MVQSLYKFWFTLCLPTYTHKYNINDKRFTPTFTLTGIDNYAKLLYTPTIYPIGNFQSPYTFTQLNFFF